MSKTGTYLGDGAYVEWNGWSYVIYTSNGIERTNEVYLEPQHIRALNEFIGGLHMTHTKHNEP